jgi:hypothetical protein
MYRNQILMIILVMFIMMSAVPVAHAQESFDVNDIISALGPRTDNTTDLMFDIFLYSIFFLCMINMAFISDKQQLLVIMNFGVMIMALVSKLMVGTHAAARLGPNDFGTLILNVGLMVLPLSIAGMARKDKGQKSNHAVIPAVIAGFLGAAYFFLFWVIEMADLSELSQF